MDNILINDLSDSRLEQFLSLRDGSKGNPGVFVVDGSNLFSKAMTAGLKLKSVLIEQGREHPKLLPKNNDFTSFEIPRTLLRSVPGYGHHRGVIGLFYIPEFEKNVRDLEYPILVLEELTNSENVGAIMRSAAAFGVKSIILSPGCSHPFLRRSVRVSMGGAFALSFFRSSDLVEDLVSMKGKGLTLFCLEQSKKAINLKSVFDISPKFMLALGSEGPGMNAEVLELADQILEIKHHGTIDSLNVAQSCTLGLYQLIST
jgi:tRNA G18 (ribose-2'-O)-methylase SpoU